MSATAFAPSKALARRTSPRLAWLLAAVALLLLAILASLALGSRTIAFGDVIGILLGQPADATERSVVLDLRIPRTVLGLLAGAALGLAGAIMQGLTRNPLADPGLLGVNAGASLAVVLSIGLLGITTPAGYVWFAFIGAAAAAALVYAIGALGNTGATPVKLVLAGTAITAGLTSLINLVLLTDTGAFDRFRLWTVGSLAARDASLALQLLPFLAVGAVLAIAAAGGLNVLALGDDTARGLGANVPLLRTVSLVAVVILCGSATAMAGPLVFVGLVAPQVARTLVAADLRWVLPLSALLGASLVLFADVVGRLVVQPGELEAGVVVALVGVPVLVWVARRKGLVKL